MASGSTWFTIFMQALAVCLTLTQGSSSPLCSSAGSSCAANTELIAAISEHSSSDHLLYVQMKANRVAGGPAPSAAEEALAKAAEGHDNHESQHVHYEPPPPNEFGDGYAASVKEEEEEEHVDASYADLTWAYVEKAGGVKGPWQWGEIAGFEACSGGLQSPINAQWKNAKSHPSLSIKDLELTKLATDCNMSTEFTLNEHTAKMSYPGPCGRTFKATWKGKDFYLSQFNYHAPSEHTIDGAFYPMEVQHVHKADDGQALIIASLVAQTKVEELHNSQERVAYEFMLAFIKNIPTPTDHKNNRFTVMKETEMWDPYDDFLAGHLGEYFLHYVGSLTKPPCTTDTVWIIDPIPINVPFTVIHYFRELINQDPINQLAPFGTIQQMGPHVAPNWAPDAGMDDSPWHVDLKCNTRPTQSMDGRTVWIINRTVAAWTTPEPLPGSED